MFPISLTANVIAVLNLAAQSCTLTYNFVARRAETAQAIADSKSTLLESEKSLEFLKQIITGNEYESEAAAALQSIKLVRILQFTHELRNDFRATLSKGIVSTSDSSHLLFSMTNRSPSKCYCI